MGQRQVTPMKVSNLRFRDGIMPSVMFVLGCIAVSQGWAMLAAIDFFASGLGFYLAYRRSRA